MAGRRRNNAGKRELARRPSLVVDRRGLDRLAMREEVARRLRVHDPDDQKPARFTDGEFEILRQIATETNVASPDPWVRRHAISLLAAQPSKANLNALTLVARLGPDVDARGEALLALGRSGLIMAAPILAEALDASDELEAEAAARGIRALAEQAGGPAVLQALPRRSAARLKRIEAILVAVPARRSRRTPASTRADDARSGQRR
jgi:HEAT repeats